MPRSERNSRAGSCREAVSPSALALLLRTDARQVRPALAQISLQRPNRGAPQRNNAFLVALAAHVHAAGIQRQIARRERRHLGNAQAAGIEQFQNGAVAQCGGLACGCEAAMPARSSISATSGSASDLGSTFHALGDSILTVGS
jgi:hypothetical protein